MKRIIYLGSLFLAAALVWGDHAAAQIHPRSYYQAGWQFNIPVATEFVSPLIGVLAVSDGREYVVTEGLAEGDVIVAEGVGTLKEGTVIN